MNPYHLSDMEYRQISGLVRERFGINLGDHKQTLIVERLQRELRLGGFESFTEYYRHVMQDASGRALLTLVDRISTNHTFFFRESTHFDFLREAVLPQAAAGLRERGRSDIRLWSAGCSSGEEPYTLAMVVAEGGHSFLRGMKTGILATDISVSVLERAAAVIYSGSHMSQVSPALRKKYFIPQKDGSWRVNSALKNMVLFRRLNLMRQEYPFKGLFQAIFCRNVMIYFDNATRNAILEKFCRYLEPGGYLFLGHAESMGRHSRLFRYIRPAVYQKI
jgi:chemotaxis protein methyltransferase CheR